MLSVMALLAGVSFAATPLASSELKRSDGSIHRAALAFDGMLSTAWAEGESGDGDGSWVELVLDRITRIESVSVWPGNLENGQYSLRENGRPHTVTVTLTTKDGAVENTVRIVDPSAGGPLRVDVPVSGEASAVRVTVDKTYSGGIRDDTYVAEIALNFVRGDAPSAVDRLKTWLASDAGKGALDDSRKEVDALTQKISTEQFGDREALTAIMNRAADGAPFLRDRVNARVPTGYRMSALSPDMAAVEALLSLKDANAIPAIALAAARSKGKLQKQLDERVQMFAAYQDLVGGGTLNIPAFGTSGFTKGALRGFGDPLGVAVDGYGGVFVADVGNNRVQRFSFSGISEMEWGAPEPALANAWFSDTRAWYASGKAAGSDPGEFTNPMDVAVVPGKFADTVFALDATGRVQSLGKDGVATVVFELEDPDALSGGVGGEAHLVFAKNRLVVFWGRKATVLTVPEPGAMAQRLGSFTLTDGVPRCAVGLRNGKIAICYDRKLVLYSIDGFRHGSMLGGALSEGFEAMDAAVDPKGKLWVVTDKGELVKFKKPGVVDYRVQFVDYTIGPPRLAVYDDVAFITHDDKITKVDALELAAKAALVGPQP